MSSGRIMFYREPNLFDVIILVSPSVSVSVLGQCSSQDVQALGLHGHDGTGKTNTYH